MHILFLQESLKTKEWQSKKLRFYEYDYALVELKDEFENLCAEQNKSQTRTRNTPTIKL